MNNHLKTRSDKIKFLQSIAQGKATVEDFKPVTFEFWRGYNDAETYTNELTGEVITSAQLEDKQRNPGKTLLWVEVLNTSE